MLDMKKIFWPYFFGKIIGGGGGGGGIFNVQIMSRTGLQTKDIREKSQSESNLGPPENQAKGLCDIPQNNKLQEGQ